LLLPGLWAADWHRWRGPDLNGISAEKGWLSAWPAEGPRQMWKASVGLGFSSMSVSQGRVYTLGNQKDQDTVYCFDAETGKVLWKHTYASKTDPKYYEGGTSSTPTVDGEAVYTLGRFGDLFCFEAVSGKVVWSKNVHQELGVEIPTWGFAGSPLVHGHLLVLNVGEAGAAFEKKTGKSVWTTGKGAAGYSTPLPFAIGSQQGLALFGGKALIAVDAVTGRELWRHLWKTDYDINAADPIFHRNQVFISSGYNTGGGLVEVTGTQTREVWKSQNMHNQFNSCVLIDGYLYGTSGHDGRESDLRCVDWSTGEVKWKERSVGLGALMAADGKLIVQADKGELLIVEAKPSGFKALSRAQVLGGKCWTTPVLSHGRIYARSARGDLVCLDVRPAAGAWLR
jgi:outer membrane protein assembly factor BamB